MSHRKLILVCFLKATLIYVVLALPWPGLRNAYRAVYRATANTVYGRFGDEGTVRFLKPDRQTPEPETDDHPIIVEMTRKTVQMQEVFDDKGNKVRRPVTDGARGTTEVPTGRVGFVPTIELIALVLASPVPWRRRGWALLWGLILVTVFTVGRLALVLFYYFSQESSLRQFDWGPTATKTVAWAYEFFFVSPTCSFLFPALIWAVVTFRRSDLQRVLAFRDGYLDDDEDGGEGGD